MPPSALPESAAPLLPLLEPLLLPEPPLVVPPDVLPELLDVLPEPVLLEPLPELLAVPSPPPSSKTPWSFEPPFAQATAMVAPMVSPHTTTPKRVAIRSQDTAALSLVLPLTRDMGTARRAFLPLAFLPAAAAAASLLLAGSWLGCETSSAPASAAGDDSGAAIDVVSEPAPPYTQTLLNNAHIGSNGSLPDFQKATASVELTGGPFAQVTLVVDLVSPCFPWSNWKTDPPPAGQNWPADCDAFDRNFEMSLVSPDAADAGDADVVPGLELVRAITPFGGPEHIEQDVTDVFNSLQGQGARTFQVIIPTYSDSAGMVSGSNGGWYVSAQLNVTPGNAPANVLAVIPLYYDSVTAGETIAAIPFTMPPGTTSSRLEYRVTGHGGADDPSTSCIGPAEEFCKRLHHVYLDDQSIDMVTPWRSDCAKLCTLADGGPGGSTGQYCEQNPCGDPASVRASRANWCPGSETPPIALTPAALSTPGAHAFKFAIDDIYMGGDWRVSAVAYAYGN